MSLITMARPLRRRSLKPRHGLRLPKQLSQRRLKGTVAMRLGSELESRRDCSRSRLVVESELLDIESESVPLWLERGLSESKVRQAMTHQDGRIHLPSGTWMMA